MDNMGGKKLKVGWFTLTCSEDSSIMFVELLNDHYFEWKKVVEFRHCKMLKEKNELSDIDVAFVEGAVSSPHEENMLKEIRNASKKLVAIGACAVTGMPSGHRNLFDAKTKKEISKFLQMYHLNENVQPLKAFVKVDAEVPGCPMDTNRFLAVLNTYLKEFGVV